MKTGLNINEMLKYVWRHKPIPPTYKDRPFIVKLDRIDLGGGEKRRCNLILVSGDYSGREYENAMERFKNIEGIKQGGLPDDLVKFNRMVLDSDGVIVIVDLVGRRPLTPQQFEEQKNVLILNALSEQVSPLSAGIELLLTHRKKIKNKPFFFVFTKSDVHRLSMEEISKYFDSVMAISLRRLEKAGVVIKKYAVSSLGWKEGKLDDAFAQGFIDLIRDISKFFVKR